MPDATDKKNEPNQTHTPLPGTVKPGSDQSLNTSVTEDERTEGGPVDESGDPKLDTTNDT